MSDYEEFRKLLLNRSDSQKLVILRAESIRLLARISGYATILKKTVAERDVPELPDDFEKWCEVLLSSSHELQDLIEASIDEHRDVRREQEAVRKAEWVKEMWEYDKQVAEELQPFESMLEAVAETAQSLDLKNDLFSPNVILDKHHRYPLFKTKSRWGDVGVQKRDDTFGGYRITLNWLQDPRNMEWKDYTAFAATLKDAIKVLHAWLILELSIEELIQRYPWVGSEHIS